MNPAEFDNIALSERDFWWYRGQRDILNRVLDPVAKRGWTVLEAGCGTGYQSKVLTERYGWRMVPLDLGYEGLEYAHKYGLTRLVQGDITALPFGARAFDALISLDVLVHLPRGVEDRAWDEFARVLKPGGLLAVRVSAFDLLRSRHSQFAHERQRFTKARVCASLERAGFTIERATYCNSLLLPVALFKFRVWEPLTKAPASSGVEPVSGWLDAALSLPLKMEASWIGAGNSFPAGQSLLVIAKRSATNFR